MSCVTICCAEDCRYACRLESVIEIVLKELVCCRDRDSAELVKTHHCKPELVVALQNEHYPVTLLDAE